MIIFDFVYCLNELNMNKCRFCISRFCKNIINVDFMLFVLMLRKWYFSWKGTIMHDNIWSCFLFKQLNMNKCRFYTSWFCKNIINVDFILFVLMLRKWYFSWIDSLSGIVATTFKLYNIVFDYKVSMKSWFCYAKLCVVCFHFGSWYYMPGTCS